MKNVLSVLLAICIAFLIVSCNSNENVSSQITSSVSASSKKANTLAVSSESSIVTSSVSAISKEETSSNSSKSNTSVIASNTNVTSKNTYKQATDSDNNITVASDGTVSITIPKWFLLKTEPDYNYQLTDKEANVYKFKSVIKNADGSATYKIGYNDYYGFLLISQSNVNAVVNKYKNNIWFSKIDCDAGYNNIKIYTKYNSLEDFDDDFGVYIAMSGLQTTFYQYMNYNYSVGTTITVYNKENVVLASYKFPDLLK